MLKHNFLIVFRNFKRDKSTFFINLIGLSTGLACALLIYLWVNDELNIDSFHKNDSRLYQVMQNYELANGIVTWDYTPANLAKALLEEMPEVEISVTLNSSYIRPRGMFSNENIHMRASGRYASKDFFRLFSYQLIQGNSEKVLTDKNAIVLSENLALKLFNTTENIIGKTVKGNHDLYDKTYQVTGVFKNSPVNSTDKFDFLFSYELLLAEQEWTHRWESDPAETYLILKKGTDVNHFNKKIAGFLRSKTPTREPSTLFLQQYSKRYLYGNYENGVQAGGRITYVKLFSVIAVFILLIAGINFINMSTANASTRLKEIGIKKTLGANRKTLMVQYLSEAMLLTFLSLFIALVIVEMFLPQYNNITGKHLSLSLNLNLLISIAAITFLTGIISGSYPALYISRFSPVNIIKGKVTTSAKELWIRKGLVVFQFTLSIIFIISFFIINKQVEFTQTKNLGYSRDNILCFQWQPAFNTDLTGFLARLKNIPGVMNASNMSGSIVSDIYIGSGYSWKGDESDKNYAFKNLQIDYDCIETLGIDVIEGRSFSREFGDNYSEIILNEAAVKKMGLKNPVGKTVEYGNDGVRRQIIGVVKNFNYGSLHESVKPLILTYNPAGRKIMVKMKAGTERAAIERLEKIYKEFNAGQPLEFTFLDDEYQNLYDSEMRTGKLSKYFAGLAIIISCLGLFALASFTAQKRRKEIGIRKVLGSSEIGIIYLLSSEFTKLVIVSILIAVPLSYLITKSWLQDFAYRINITWWIFAFSGGIALVIALATVSFQAIKAATANPVEALRYE